MTQEESQQLFTAIVNGELEPAQLAAALISMKVRGEQPAEIAGAATGAAGPRSSLSRARIILLPISSAPAVMAPTASIFPPPAPLSPRPVVCMWRNMVTAACPVGLVHPIYWPRLVSVWICQREESRAALDDLGVCFLFAPQYHTGFRHAMPVRKALKTRTLFNVLGPLINPARPPLALIGVYSPELVQTDCRNAAHAGL